MSYSEWYEAAEPLAAQAHFNARAASSTPQAYAYATTLISGYASARERGVKKSKHGGVAWPPIPTDVKAPFRVLVDGFENIVRKCTAPKPQYAVRTAAAIQTTDVMNAISNDSWQQSYLFQLYRKMHLIPLCLADFTPFLEPNPLDTPGSPPGLSIHLLRLDALDAVYHWLADIKQSEAPADRLAFLLRFHYGGAPFEANIVAMTAWLTARTEEEKHRWSAAKHILDTNRRSRSYNA